MTLLNRLLGPAKIEEEPQNINLASIQSEFIRLKDAVRNLSEKTKSTRAGHQSVIQSLTAEVTEMDKILIGLSKMAE